MEIGWKNLGSSERLVAIIIYYYYGMFHTYVPLVFSCVLSVDIYQFQTLHQKRPLRKKSLSPYW